MRNLYCTVSNASSHFETSTQPSSTTKKKNTQHLTQQPLRCRRYTFAISVQTARGPTSVRVFYCMGKFRLDAEPRLAMAMPLFDCPVRMLEYYCEYSKRMDEHRQEVWVDYSGQVYSQIYLGEPLVKEVRSLSHLARIAVNRAATKLDPARDRLPPLIRNYLREYPYTL